MVGDAGSEALGRRRSEGDTNGAPNSSSSGVSRLRFLSFVEGGSSDVLDFGGVCLLALFFAHGDLADDFGFGGSVAGSVISCADGLGSSAD